jgi:hypothetical protein
MRREALGIALAALASSCATLAPREGMLPAGAVEIAPPAVYREWSLRTQTCSGLTGNFSAVKWYVVPGVETFPTADGPKVGLWTSSGRSDRIIIAGAYEGDEMVVSHELLHHLIRHAGHPADYFVTRCHLTWESWEAAQGKMSSGSGDRRVAATPAAGLPHETVASGLSPATGPGRP